MIDWSDFIPVNVEDMCLQINRNWLKKKSVNTDLWATYQTEKTFIEKIHILPRKVLNLL